MARKGLPAKYAKMGFKKGWKAYKKSKKKRKASNPRPRRKARKVRKVARRRRYIRKARKTSKSIQRTVEKFVGIGAFLYPGLRRGSDVWTAEHDAVRAITEGLGQYAGLYDGGFHFDVAVNAWAPYLTFSLFSKGVHKLNGILRRL